jgi:hypothetical protein
MSMFLSHGIRALPAMCGAQPMQMRMQDCYILLPGLKLQSQNRTEEIIIIYIIIYIYYLGISQPMSIPFFWCLTFQMLQLHAEKPHAQVMVSVFVVNHDDCHPSVAFKICRPYEIQKIPARRDWSPFWLWVGCRCS